MRQFYIEKKCDPRRRTKYLSVWQSCEDKECRTWIRKNFVYLVKEIENISPSLNPPQVFVKKVFDSKNNVEKFVFTVKGCFYVTYKRWMYKVRFHHGLNIELLWKTKIFSPKKSAVVT